jgi:ankyrin repeat protein
MIQGTITYTQKGQAPGGVVHSSELEYTGFVDSAGARHGKGSLTWSGPLHPLGFVTCVGDFYNDHALGDCKVTFHEGHKFEGKMANSLMVQGNLELADGRVFTGSFNEAQFMHGNGTMLFEDQRRFTGEFAENNHSTGTTLYPNGIKYQSTFYVNTKADKKICHPCFCSENNFKNENKDFPFSSKYVQPRPQCLRCARDLIHIRKYGNGSGVVTFSDGFEYQHSPEVSGSFQDRVANLIAGRLAAAEAINSQVVSAMTELDIWPKVKPVEPILIDEKFATPLFTAREIGGEDRLRAKFNTWRDLMDQLENLSRRSAGLLEKELARNKSLVERFGDRWTLPPSAQINLVFHQRLNRGTDILQDERSKCVADYAHLEEHKQKLVALLKPASVYEKELFDKEETCSLRLRMIELNKSVHEVMERRVKLLDEYKQLALSLDIIPALASLPDASASHLEIVIADTLQKLDPLCRDLEATASQHRELMEQSKRAHAELEAFKTLLRTSIRDQMCAFILAGTELFDYLNPRLDSAIGTNQTFLTNQRAELADAAAVMVADRETQSREVAASLLHAELEAAIAARNIETCKSIIDHKIPDIKLQIDAPNSNGDTLVSQAIMLGHSELIKVLADGGADMELRYNSHYSYLYFAIQDKRCDQKSIIPTATALIAAKADPNAIADNKEQVCMVQIVAREDRLDILQALVEKKADLRREVKNKSGLGRTALHWACAANLKTTSMVFYLIKNGLIINQIDNDLNTPLHFARNIKTSVMLVENGAQLNAKNKNNVRAMDECLATLTSNGVSDDDIKDVNFRWKQLERTARQRITFNIGNVGEEPTPDNNVPACLCCGTKFSSLTRRNNCRVCNLVSCANCVPKRVEATQAGSVVKVRMCDGCYNQGFYKLQG